ncbi:hypothetical protein G7009_24175 [Pseudomonas capeferrum]|uniref:hypothetical protein n=1 Tax=Pseudomonas capeferrum TaxID=1495066 RepID=UPI0015E41204|nr:hypothetical protein [Pseudomonas capeferrum]MBA1204817.1 hypothetical protein [Pseudomonas capeferrum]
MSFTKPGSTFYLTATLLMSALLGGCTTQLTEKGQQINLVTASSVNACYLVETFTVQGWSADDALNTAFNKAAELGVDSMGVKSVSEGDEITALAFDCRIDRTENTNHVIDLNP